MKTGQCGWGDYLVRRLIPELRLTRTSDRDCGAPRRRIERNRAQGNCRGRARATIVVVEAKGGATVDGDGDVYWDAGEVEADVAEAVFGDGRERGGVGELAGEVDGEVGVDDVQGEVVRREGKRPVERERGGTSARKFVEDGSSALEDDRIGETV